MAQNYIRQSSFNDGDTITASLFNNEYNQLVNAFTYSSSDVNATGHRHDGTTGEGGNIYRIGDVDFRNLIEADTINDRWGFWVSVAGTSVEQVRIQDGVILPVTTNDIDLGSSGSQFKDLYIDGTANIDSLIADTADINGGTMDAVDVTVGAGKTLDVSAGTLTLADNQISGDKVEGGTINATTINTLTFGDLNDGTITINGFVDEDAMTSNSATLIPTQQSVKAYVDAQVTAQDLDASADSGTISIDLDSETLTVSGGEGIDTSASGNTITISGEDASTSNKGVASFSADDFNVSGGAVTLATTATTTELNFVDGVTSNIQTQLNNKQPLDAQLTDVAGLTPADGSFIVGNGTNFVAESGDIAIASLGVTATAAELNTLDGITATTTELNYTDGVTSNIQTQLNSKASATASPTITLGGDLSGSATLTNLGNATLTATVADDSHNHIISNVDGLQTALDGKATTAQGALADTAVQPDDNVSFGTGNFTGDVDVTGTVQADGLTVDGDATITKAVDAPLTIAYNGGNSSSYGYYQIINNNVGNPFEMHTGGSKTLNLGANGDVSFYEDTGTTAKMVWDASAESLSLPTLTTSKNLTSSKVASTYDPVAVFNSQAGTSKLRIDDASNSSATTRLFITHNYSRSSSGFSADNSAVGVSGITFDNGEIGLSTASAGNDVATKRVTVDSAGNVGIGTDSPLSYRKMTIQSDGSSGGIALNNSSGALGAQFTLENTGTSTDLGIYSTGVAKFYTGGTERARIDGSGTFMVGTTTGSTGLASGIAMYQSGRSFYSVDDGYVMNINRLSSDGEIIRLRKDGSTVGSIGVTNSLGVRSSYYASELGTGITFGSVSMLPSDGSGILSSGTKDLGYSNGKWKDLYLSGGVKGTNLTFSGNNGTNEHMRLDSSGNLRVGNTSTDISSVGGRMLADGRIIAVTGSSACFTARRLTSNGNVFTFVSAGGVEVGSISITSSTTSYNTSSDERLKENIQDTTHTVDIDDIQVREFDWKTDGSHQRYGFIAQELETVYPEAVHSPEDTDEMKSVDYSKLVPLLVKEIQQLKSRIQTLENK